MDAVTSFELEAQRRRETVAGDRWAAAWTARAESTVEAVEAEASERSPRLAVPGRRTERGQAAAECQPAPATR